MYGGASIYKPVARVSYVASAATLRAIHVSLQSSSSKMKTTLDLCGLLIEIVRSNLMLLWNSLNKKIWSGPQTHLERMFQAWT